MTFTPYCEAPLATPNDDSVSFATNSLESLDQTLTRRKLLGLDSLTWLLNNQQKRGRRHNAADIEMLLKQDLPALVGYTMERKVANARFSLAEAEIWKSVGCDEPFKSSKDTTANHTGLGRSGAARKRKRKSQRPLKKLGHYNCLPNDNQHQSVKQRLEVALRKGLEQAEASRLHFEGVLAKMGEGLLSASEAEAVLEKAGISAVPGANAKQAVATAFRGCIDGEEERVSFEGIVRALAAQQRLMSTARHLGWSEPVRYNAVVPQREAAAPTEQLVGKETSLLQTESMMWQARQLQSHTQEFDENFTRDTPRALKSKPQDGPVSIEELRNQLEIAEAGLKELNSKVREDVTWVQSNLSVKVSGQAAHSCFRWGAEKIASLTTALEVRSKRRGLLAWRKHRAYAENLATATSFMKQKGAGKAHAVLCGWAERRRLEAWLLWRGGVGRQRRREQQAASVLLQRMARGFLGRRKVLFIMKEKAAITIQTRVRGKLGSNKAARVRVRKEREQAAAAIQKAARDKEERRRAQKIVQRRREEKASLHIQACYRGSKGRARAAELKEMKLEQESAVKVQGAYRGVLGRRRAAAARAEHEEQQALARLEEEERSEAALKIQACQRGSIARRRSDELAMQRAQSKAALSIQKIHRGRKGRGVATVARQNNSQAMEREKQKAATAVQRAVRGEQGRRVAKTRAEQRRKDKAAVAVQRAARGRQGRVQANVKRQKLQEDQQAARKTKMNEDEAATAIQSAQRCRSSRRRTSELRRKRHLQLKLGEGVWGANNGTSFDELRREAEHEPESERKDEAGDGGGVEASPSLTSDEELRPFHGNKSTEDSKEADAARMIQAVARGNSARSAITHEAKAATSIQAKARGRAARRLGPTQQRRKEKRGEVGAAAELSGAAQAQGAQTEAVDQVRASSAAASDVPSQALDEHQAAGIIQRNARRHHAAKGAKQLRAARDDELQLAAAAELDEEPETEKTETMETAEAPVDARYSAQEVAELTSALKAEDARRQEEHEEWLKVLRQERDALGQTQQQQFTELQERLTQEEALRQSEYEAKVKHLESEWERTAKEREDELTSLRELLREKEKASSPAAADQGALAAMSSTQVALLEDLSTRLDAEEAARKEAGSEEAAELGKLREALSRDERLMEEAKAEVERQKQELQAQKLLLGKLQEASIAADAQVAAPAPAHASAPIVETPGPSKEEEDAKAVELKERLQAEAEELRAVMRAKVEGEMEEMSKKMKADMAKEREAQEEKIKASLETQAKLMETQAKVMAQTLAAELAATSKAKEVAEDWKDEEEEEGLGSGDAMAELDQLLDEDSIESEQVRGAVTVSEEELQSLRQTMAKELEVSVEATVQARVEELTQGRLASLEETLAQVKQQQAELQEREAELHEKALAAAAAAAQAATSSTENSEAKTAGIALNDPAAAAAPVEVSSQDAAVPEAAAEAAAAAQEESGGASSLVVTNVGDPNEWVEYYDDNAGASYFFNTVTQEASWTDPRGVGGGSVDMSSASGGASASNGTEGERAGDAIQTQPSAWTELLDPSSGVPYWYNSITREASWEVPREIAQGGVGAAGAPNFEHPEDWVCYLDEETGEEYWFNIKTGETQWEGQT